MSRPDTRRLAALLLLGAATLVVGTALPASGQEPLGRRPQGGEDVLAIVGGDVHVGTGRVIRRGTVLCRDGKIDAVGRGLSVPEGARVVDASGLWVLPGFVAPRGQNIGVRRGRPRRGERFGQCLEAESTYCEIALSVGITAYMAESTQRGTYSDMHAVVKPAYNAPELMLVKEPAALTVAWSRQTVTNRSALRSMFAKAQSWITGGRKGRAPASSSVIAALDRSIPTRISARTRGEIRAALEFAEEFDLRLVLLDATEAWTMPGEIAASGALTVVQPRRRTWPSPGTEETSGSRITTAGVLEKAGAPFCVLPPGGYGGPGWGISLGGVVGRDLLTYPVEGAFAMRGGTSRDATLRAITLTAAEACGVEDRLGSLEVGKDADVVLYQGDPFDYRKMAETTIVSGRVLYERSKSTLFGHLGASDGNEDGDE